jgi:transcriptional regulator with AAA-type ATPase domain
VEAWLSLWTPELGKDHTAVIIADVDLLPLWAAQELHQRVAAARTYGNSDTTWSLTAESLGEVPEALRRHVDTVVQVPPLRDRPGDVLTLARYAAYHSRAREIGFTVAAEHALCDHGWPGNIDELFGVVHDAALQTDVIDVKHLPADVASGSGHRLSRIESFERDEIVRCLGTPEITVKAAAIQLGMSRATLYRKMAHYRIRQTRH